MIVMMMMMMTMIGMKAARKNEVSDIWSHLATPTTCPIFNIHVVVIIFFVIGIIVIVIIFVIGILIVIIFVIGILIITNIWPNILIMGLIILVSVLEIEVVNTLKCLNKWITLELGRSPECCIGKIGSSKKSSGDCSSLIGVFKHQHQQQYTIPSPFLMFQCSKMFKCLMSNGLIEIDWRIQTSARHQQYTILFPF